MQNSTHAKLRHRIFLMLLSLFLGLAVSAQDVLMTQSFENGGTMPAGWAKTTVSGSDALSFVTTSSYPSGFTAYDGSYMVRFGSFSYSSAVNRLYSTNSFSTVGKDNVTVEFAWLESMDYATTFDNVVVQWSPNGTTWTDACTFNRPGPANAWTVKSCVLPDDAENQPTLFVAFLFTSAYGNDCYLDDVTVYGTQSGGIPVTATIGTGTTTQGYPFYTFYQDSRTQILWTAAEILAAGGTAGDILSIGFNVSSYASQVMNGFNIDMQNYSGSTISSFVTSGWTNVYTGTAQITASGWKTFNLQTPFEWDGTSNLLVNICFDNTSYTSNTYVYSTSQSGMTYHYHTDGAAGCSFTSGSSYSYRPNVQLAIEPPLILPTGVLQGYVTNLYGVPIAGATVFATNEYGDFLTTSGPNGAYQFTDISVGIYDVQAWKDGYNVSTTSNVIVYEAQTTYLNLSLTQPSMAITPNPYTVTVNPNEYLDGAFNISNMGNGPLGWTAEIEFLEPTVAAAPQVTGPGLLEGMTQVESLGPESMIPAGNGVPLSSRDLMTCPEGSKFSIIPQGSDNGYTSSGSYHSYQGFNGIEGSFNTLTFWSLYTSAPSGPMNFTIEVRAPGAQPGAVLYTYSVSLTGVNTGVPVIGYPVFQYTFEFPESIALAEGYIGVYCTSGSPTNYWLNTYAPGPAGFQYNGSSYVSLPERLAMCLGGFAGGWLTLGSYEGTVPAFTNYSLPAYFNADGLDVGTYQANVTFTSNPNVGTAVVPVTMIVAGDPLTGPEDLTAVLTDPIEGLVSLTWSFQPPAGFLNFIVKRDGVTIGTTTGNSMGDDLPTYGVYQYTVQAVYAAGNSVPAGPVELEWPNPTIMVDPTYIYDEVWVNQTAVQTVTINNTGEGTLAFSFPDWVDTDNGTRVPLAYCTASGGCDEYISRIQFNTIDNSSGCSQYADYTSIVTELEIGETYVLTVTNPNPYSSDQVGVWIDWNQNEVFTDAGEFFTAQSSGGGASFTSSILVPETATSGPTRMRIRLMYSGTLSSCGTSSYGEVEDYTVDVGLPGFITSVVPASGTVPAGGSKTIAITWDATGFDPGFSYFEDLIVQSNDLDNPSVTITNEMYVYTPAQFAGTVTDIVTGEPLNGVLVTAMPSGTFETYILDDGTYESGFGYTSGGTGSIGDIFNTSDEGLLTSVDAYFDYGGAMTTPVNIEIYDAAHNLLGVSEPQIINNPGWYTFNLPNIPYSGTFYCMMHYPTVSGSTRYLGWDNNGPNANANYSYEYWENAWSTFQSFGYYGVLLIRPTAFVTGETAPVTYNPGPSPKITGPLHFAVVDMSGSTGMRGTTTRERDLVSFQTVTDDQGEYSLYVDPGVYNVSFEKTGYQTYIEYDTTALAGIVTPLDAQLREESYPPSFVYAEVNETDTEVLVTWGNGSGPYEIIYDDGSAENFAAWAVPGNMNAVKFTPASYPATVIGGKIYVGDGSFPNNNTGFIGTTFGAMVIDDDGANGLPGTVLDSISVEVLNYGWLSFSGLNAEITDGSFYLVMVQGTFSPNTAPIGVDQQNPIVYRSYSRNVSAGLEWGLSPYQDFMMRAVVFGSPSGTDDALTETIGELRSASKFIGLISQSPAMAAAGGVEGTGIFKAALDFNDGSRAVTGYRVVRYSNFDPDASPATGTVTNLANNIQGNEYTDMAWAGLPAGWYAYGVAARYPDNYVSDTIISNIVGHNIDGTVTINISLTTGGSPAGAFVSMTGQDYPYEVYSATVPESGQVIFDAVWFGNYAFHAEKIGFDDYDMITLVNGDETIDVILAEKKYKPRNLYVDPLTLVATWDEPLAIAVIEDFEGSTFPPAGWQALTQNTTGWYATTNGSSSSFTIPSHSKYAVTNDDADNGNGCCDYLITPEMNWTDLPTYRMNFASFYTGAYSQSAYVEISTDAGASWTVIYTLSPASAWTDLEIDLAQYSGATGLQSVWVAFHGDDNGQWASGWAIDDVQISSGGVPLQGYGVFLDGTLVGNTVERTFTYTNLNYGQEYLAGVAGLYSSGYSELDTYLFRSLYLIPPDNLAGENPDNTNYVHLTWTAPVVPTAAPGTGTSVLPVIIPQPAADVATSVNTNTFPQRSVPLSSSRDVLFDNGPLVNSPGTGSGGADESILQGGLGMTTYGFGMQQSAGNSVADDFEVPANWTLESIEFFGYQTGSSTTSTFTGVFFQIYDGNPMSGGQIIYGDLTTNKLLSTQWANIYRNDNGPGGSTDRPVMQIVADASGITLEPGTYWIEWTTTGSGSSGPWVPPITIDGQTTTGNAIQNQAGSWVALTDVGPQGLPFIINGSGGGGGPTVANLLGYNIYRDDALIAYVLKPALEYFDLNLDPGTYSYHITAVYDLTVYGYPGQTGESMIEGPIEVDVIYGYDLPFVEEWNTGVFTTNQWEPGSNWVIEGQTGNPAPSAMFTYTPVQSDYTLSLSSYWLNGTGYIDGSIFLDFDLKLDDNTATGEEQMIVEVFNGSSWVPVSTFTAEGDMDWTAQHLNITNAAKDKVFRIRFTAKGVNTLDINNWQIDNINVYRACDPPTDLTAEIEDVNAHGDHIVLNWVAPEGPGPGLSGWINWDDGTNVDAIGLTGGGTFLVGVRFTPDQLAEWAGTSLTKLRLFPYGPNGTIVLKVWTGANASQLMLSQPVASYVAGEWNEFALNTPVLVTGTTELWFGYEVTHNATDYVAGVDGGPAVAGYGDMISMDGSVWESMSQAYQLDYNWNLQGFLESLDGVTQLLPLNISSTYDNGNAQLVRHNYPILPTATLPVEKILDRALMYYKIYRENQLIGESVLIDTTSQTTYLDDDPAISHLGDTYCYNVVAVYEDCESPFSDQACATIVSSNDPELSAVNVYPNPSNNVVNIELTNNIGQIVMYNYVGQIVYEQIIAKDKLIQINVRNYDAGAYLIKFITKSGESFSQKIAVTK